MKIKLPNKIYLLVLAAILLGIFFRFYNLSWGSPFFFHPDERNIAISINQLSYPNQMNPHFFAYGSFPIYVIYFSGIIANYIQNLILHTHFPIQNVAFERAIIIGRIYSFILSVILMYLIYFAGNRLGGKKAGLISLVFSAFSIGFIQFAHYATFEIWLSFFTLLLCILLIKYIENRKFSFFFFSAVTMGLLISIKISSLTLIPLCILPIIIGNFYYLKKPKRKKIIFIEQIILKILTFLGVVVITLNLTSPYFWFDNNSFLSSIRYESSVALGTLPVFYTQEFEKTTPVLYQLFKVYPFILNPFVAVISIVAFIFVCKTSIEKKLINPLIIVAFFIITLFSQLFLYVKWVRYYIPTLSFIYILLGFYGSILISKFNSSIRKTIITCLFLLLTISFIYSIAFFKTVLLDADSRVVAALWATKHISAQSKILSEVYDIGIVPFNSSFSSIKLFNFYDLDSNSNKTSELKSELVSSGYIIVPSQRILQTRIERPDLFHSGNIFYGNLIHERGFKKIYETPCDLLCKILYLGNPINSYEQTANIFDHPQVYIFRHE